MPERRLISETKALMMANVARIDLVEGQNSSFPSVSLGPTCHDQGIKLAEEAEGIEFRRRMRSDA